MSLSNLGKRFLLWCANEHNDFRIPEILSIISIFKIDLEWVEKNTVEPYVIVDVQSEEDIRKIMSRSILIRSAYELWGRGKTHTEMHEKMRQLPSDFIKPYTESSFSIKVESFCKTLSLEHKIKLIEEFDYLPLKGPIKLANPEQKFLLYEYYISDGAVIPKNPEHIFFGRLICDGQRNVIQNFNLRGRKFIGNTSMDPQLSLIMANLALVEPQSIVFDPFVGTGSIMVAAAYFGAYIWGVDIDYKLLHGKAKPSRCNAKLRDDGECVAANFQQYSFNERYMDVIVGDSSKSFWRDEVLFDAILTDPPYGVREAKSKVGKRKKDNPLIKPEHLRHHVPSKVNYNVDEMYADLLNYAARHLKIGGRLVFWVPVFFKCFDENDIPKHPCFTVESLSKQGMPHSYSRLLITMSKIKHPKDENDRATKTQNLQHYAERYIQCMLDEPSDDQTPAVINNGR